jgi:hypothetical protein
MKTPISIILKHGLTPAEYFNEKTKNSEKYLSIAPEMNECLIELEQLLITEPKYSNGIKYVLCSYFPEIYTSALSARYTKTIANQKSADLDEHINQSDLKF